jgi:hypothetical protein
MVVMKAIRNADSKWIFIRSRRECGTGAKPRQVKEYRALEARESTGD